MAVLMVSLNSTKTGDFVARKAIPKDARAEYKRLHGVRREAILKIPAGTPKAQAKALHGQWLAEVETRIARIRAAAKGEGQPLTKLNALALAGRWYSWFVAQYEEDPGPPEHWRGLSEHFVWDILNSHAPREHHEDPNADSSWPWRKNPEVREAVRPVVVEMARTTSFLTSEGLALSTDANCLFVDAVSDLLNAAFVLLEQRANGDYSRDTVPETFPEYRDTRVSAPSGMNCWDLFGAYVAAKKPAAGTVNRWRAVFNALQAAFPQKSAGAITQEDAQAWKDTQARARVR
jgi:hypothetical protein